MWIALRVRHGEARDTRQGAWVGAGIGRDALEWPESLEDGQSSDSEWSSMHSGLSL